jgi:hypothetical protein
VYPRSVQSELAIGCWRCRVSIDGTLLVSFGYVTFFLEIKRGSGGFSCAVHIYLSCIAASDGAIFFALHFGCQAATSSISVQRSIFHHLNNQLFADAT